jgi:hypothetical protein
MVRRINAGEIQYNGDQLIDTTSTNALRVRVNDGGAEVFAVDTSTPAIRMGAPFSGSPAVIGTFGEQIRFRFATTELTAMAGATVTASNLIPDGSFVIGVVSRVTTLIAGCTSIDIGIGSDTDMFANNSAILAGSTTTLAGHTANIGINAGGAEDVIVTAVGGAANFSAGAIRLTVCYIDLVAPTS